MGGHQSGHRTDDIEPGAYDFAFREFRERLETETGIADADEDAAREWIAALAGIETVVTVARERPRALPSVMKQLTERAVAATQRFATTLTELQEGRAADAVRISTLSAEIAMLRDQLHDAREELQRAKDRANQHLAAERERLDTIIADRDHRIARLRDAAAESSDAVLQRVTTHVQQLPGLLNDATEQISACEAEIATLRDEHLRPLDDVESIRVTVEGGVTVTRSLDDEIGRVSAAVAPLLSTLAQSDPANLSRATEVERRYDALDAHYRALGDLLREVDHDVGRIDTALQTIATKWYMLNRELDEAGGVLSRFFGRDLYLLADTTAERIEEQRKAYRAAAIACRTVLSAVQVEIRKRRSMYEGHAKAIESVRRDIHALRAYHDIPWFTGLPEGDRRTTIALVLAIPEGDRESWKFLTGILHHADDAALRAIEDTCVHKLLQSLFFEPAAPPALQEHMRLFRLTDLGRFWRSAWVLRETALAKTVHIARSSYDRTIEEERKRATVASAQRKRERAAREDVRKAQKAAATAAIAARSTPEYLREHLPAIERHLLATFAVLAPHITDEHRHWWIRAASIARIIGFLSPPPKPQTLGRTLHRLLYTADPPLLGTTATPDGSTRAALTPLAVEIVRRLPSVPSHIQQGMIARFSAPLTHWPDADRAFHRTLEECIANIRKTSAPKTP